MSADRINAWSVDKKALSTQSADKHNSTCIVSSCICPRLFWHHTTSCTEKWPTCCIRTSCYRFCARLLLGIVTSPF